MTGNASVELGEERDKGHQEQEHAEGADGHHDGVKVDGSGSPSPRRLTVSALATALGTKDAIYSEEGPSADLQTKLLRSVHGLLQKVVACKTEEELAQTCLEAAKAFSKAPPGHDELERNEEKYRRLFANAQVGMWRTKPDGSKALAVNQRLLDILGYTAEDLVAKPAIVRWADPEDRAEIFGCLEREGSVADVEVPIIASDGRIKTCLLSAQLYADDNTVEGSMVDITDRKRVEQALKRSNEDLEQFACIASRDLQEPLRELLALSDQLKVCHGDALGEQGNDYLERIQVASTRMQTLSDSLLEYVESTSHAHSFTEVNLQEIFSSVAADYGDTIEEMGGLLEACELPTVRGDPAQLRQLFSSLIDNALKFRRPQRPPIVILESIASSKMCTIEIIDNGIGFDNLHAEKIFGVFQQLHAQDEYEGTGIGLAICRRIVERHGGTICASGEEGNGAKFTIVLPLSGATSTT